MIRCSEPGCGKPLEGPERPLRPGEKVSWGGPCKACRGRRGARAAARTRELHGGIGYGSKPGRSKW